MGGNALPVRTDLTDLSQITDLVQTTLSTFGRIDILANIAGWGNYDWFEELSAEDLRNYYEVNIIGMAHLIQQVIPIMKTQRSGYILNMSSYASEIATPPLNVYASTKYAVKGLNDALRRELPSFASIPARYQARSLIRKPGVRVAVSSIAPFQLAESVVR